MKGEKLVADQVVTRGKRCWDGSSVLESILDLSSSPLSSCMLVSKEGENKQDSNSQGRLPEIKPVSAILNQSKLLLLLEEHVPLHFAM